MGAPAFVTLSEEELWLIAAVGVMVVFDVVTGLVQAWVNRDYQSSKMREGLGHKIVLVLIVALAVVIQGFTQHIGDIGWSIPIVWAVCLYILVMEVSSVVENLAAAYPELRETKLLSYFANTSAKEDENER